MKYDSEEGRQSGMALWRHQPSICACHSVVLVAPPQNRVDLSFANRSFCLLIGVFVVEALQCHIHIINVFVYFF